MNGSLDLSITYNDYIINKGAHRSHKKRKIIITNVTTMLTHICSANQPGTYIFIVAICRPLNPCETKKCLAGGLKSSVEKWPFKFLSCPKLKALLFYKLSILREYFNLESYPHASGTISFFHTKQQGLPVKASPILAKSTSR